MCPPDEQLDDSREENEIIAQRRSKLGALRESEEQFRLITESAFDGVIVLEDGKIVDANQGRTFQRGKNPTASASRRVRPWAASTICRNSARYPLRSRPSASRAISRTES